ncbi:MAG: glycosyltransferase family 4 protein [Muribaculaceae bacterium]|nr:glycosyltransferase family 4 protein [Muribaculaceae bacterium]
MTIGFDGYWAVYNHSNRGNLCRNLISAVTHHAPHHKYFIYSDYTTENRHLTPLLASANVNLKEPKHGWFNRLWRWGDGMGKDLRRHHVRLYHGMCELLPYGTKGYHTSWVLSINDLDVKRFSKEFGFWERMKKNAALRHSLRKAQRIVVPSEWGKRDLLAYYPKLKADKVCVVPPCTDSNFDIEIHPEVKTSLAAQHGLPERFVLVMGPLTAHKELLTLVKAIELLRKQHPISLVIAGPSTAYYRRVVRPYLDSHALRDYVVHIKSIHTTDLPVLYQLSQAMLCSAQGQYYSLSMLEAMDAGVPVVVPAGTAQAEMAGDAALATDNTAQGWADAIVRITTDEALRTQIIGRGRQCAKCHSAEAAAQALIECYDALLND